MKEGRKRGKGGMEKVGEGGGRKRGGAGLLVAYEGFTALGPLWDKEASNADGGAALGPESFPSSRLAGRRTRAVGEITTPLAGGGEGEGEVEGEGARARAGDEVTAGSTRPLMALFPATRRAFEKANGLSAPLAELPRGGLQAMAWGGERRLVCWDHVGPPGCGNVLPEGLSG